MGFQKALYPFDAKERSYLLMNFLSMEELIENVTILFDVSQNDEVGEDLKFPTSDEMYILLSKEDGEESRQCVEKSKKEMHR